MSSIASTIYKSLLKIFLKPKESSTLPEMVAWFRDMNVTNPKPFHAGFCQIETQRLSDTRYWTITPKQVLTDRILVYLHGGSYAGGPHLLHWHLAGSLAKKLSCRAIMLDYKLTPEYVYPTALQESIRLVEHLRQLNPAPPLLLCGDSAGAGLALATCFRLQDQAKAQPEKLILISPWLDLSLQNPAIDCIEKEDVMLMRKGVQLIGRAYAGNEPLTNPHLSPVYGELHGLPPTFVCIGTKDIFYPDTQKFIYKASAASVPITYVEEKGLFHDYPIFPFMPETNNTIGRIVSFVNTQPATSRAAGLEATS